MRGHSPEEMMLYLQSGEADKDPSDDKEDEQ